MFRSAESTHQALTCLLVVLLTMPLLVSTHDHEADHDGAILHIERSHGGHAPALVELDDRLVSQGATAPAVAATAWSLPDRLRASAHPAMRFRVDYPARPPPTPILPRAPPSIS